MNRLLIAATVGISLLSAAGAANAAGPKSMGPSAGPLHGEQARVLPAHYNGYHGYYAPPRHWHRHHHHGYGYGGYGYGYGYGYGHGRGWR